MSDQQSVVRGVNQLLGLSADLCAADTVAEAIEEAVGLGEAVFDHTVVRVCRTSMAGECDTLAASGEEQATATELVQTLCEREPTGHPTAHTQTPPVDAIETELLVPVAGRRVLRVGSRETGTVDDKDKAGAEQLARLLTQHIRRLESKDTGAVDEPTHILRRFHEITIGADDFETTVEKVLTLGPDLLGVETGVVSRIDETYTIEAVVDQTNTYTQGSTATLESDLCAEVVSRDTITPLAIADVTASELDPNPVADAIGAYLGAPIIVDGEPYGTVNFTSPTAHPREFNEEDREFVTLVAQWLGTEIERNRHVAELERDEAILEAVGDPVYAVDSDGRFTFLNESAEELFGPTEDRLGNPVGDVLSDAASRQFNDQFDQLSEQSHRSTTEAFTITTATGDCRTVENRLAQISENHGAAGVLRDET
ncbi:MAG: GAF domain-containing protein, partial [Salinarchaeum sp.]